MRSRDDELQPSNEVHTSLLTCGPLQTNNLVAASVKSNKPSLSGPRTRAARGRFLTASGRVKDPLPWTYTRYRSMPAPTQKAGCQESAVKGWSGHGTPTPRQLSAKSAVPPLNRFNKETRLTHRPVRYSIVDDKETPVQSAPCPLLNS